MQKNIDSLKVAMVVHNPVVSDARVRKEAKTIKAAGYNITLFGYGDRDVAPQTLDGIPLVITQTSSAVNVYRTTYLSIKSAYDKFIKITRRHRNKLLALNALAALFNISAIVAKLFFTMAGGGIFFHAVALCAVGIIYGLYYKGLLRNFIPHKGGLVVCAIMLMFGLYGLFSVIGILGIVYFGLVLAICGALVYFSLQQIMNKLDTFLRGLWDKMALPTAHDHIATLLSQSIMEHDFNVIHAHDIIGLMAGLKVKKSNPQTVLIWDAHELYTELAYKSPRATTFMRKIIRMAERKVNFFITINESFSEYYAKNFPKLPPATVLMNATRKSTGVLKRSGKLRTTTNIHADQKILLFQGGLAADRGISILLDAAPRFPKNWTVVFMGNGKFGNEVDDAVETHNSTRDADRPLIVHIPPAPYEELAQWTSGADVGIIPYELTSLNHLYCTPNKLWEYPNAGVPIMASGLVEMTKMISTHDTGILLPKEITSNDIVEAINKFDQISIDRLRANCFDFNEVENWENYEAALLKMYEEIKH